MAKKRKKARQQKESVPEKKESSFWMITAIVAIVLLVGVTMKTMFPSRSGPDTTQPTLIQPVSSPRSTSVATSGLQGQVYQVASQFKCACGGCGELPLAECECDMPKGAKEEKTFIRAKLMEGLSVPEVIDLVEKKYGYKAT
ncbi:MAG: hypothetical protein JSU72_10470 [Deltaproteobacteria bacterium]|nr:MAG: hypothetical protein JSU72_10470 [Deltaproteobacteria bacterium]